MNKKFLDQQKDTLLKMKQSILSGQKLKGNQDLVVNSEDMADEADLAQNVTEQNISFNLRDMDRRKLHAINAALDRIEQGSYGLCMECEEEIHKKRLEKIPTAELCIEHAEELERSVGHQQAAKVS